MELTRLLKLKQPLFASCTRPRQTWLMSGGRVNKLRPRFASQDTSMRRRVGQEFRILREITAPDNQHDAEVLPMYLIMLRDGSTFEAYPEEVFKEGFDIDS